MNQPVEIDPATVNEWYKDEISSLFLALVSGIAQVLDATDQEIADLEAEGLDESFVDRMTRDIKAAAYDKLNKTIIDLA